MRSLRFEKEFQQGKDTLVIKLRLFEKVTNELLDLASKYDYELLSSQSSSSPLGYLSGNPFLQETTLIFKKKVR